MTRPTWDEYFTQIARTVSLRADCRRRTVGAVIVSKDHKILSTGYNGTKPGNPGCLEGACPRGLMSYEEIKALSSYDNCISVHAEANAIIHAGQNCKGATIYITDEPCYSCRKLIGGAGIERIVY